MFKRWRSKPQTPLRKALSAFTTDALSVLGKRNSKPVALEWEQPQLSGVATDSSIDGTIPNFKGGFNYGVPEAQAAWYVSQSFIGYAMCAVIAKHWLVDKACTMPARDAVRQGYRLDGIDDEVLKKLTDKRRNRKMNAVMREFIATGRRFGGAAALFVVESTDPEYYEKPFNIDGIQPGQYKGIKIIEPSWMVPDLVADNIQDPASLNFYEPSFWLIGNRRYHKSHFEFYVPYPVANLAKHHYRYFGVSVPERVYERVYASERTANEAPQLAMTKRLLTMGIPDLGQADKNVVAENIAYFVEIRDNYGVQISDAATVFNQFDTALADLDVTVMTQYQLVAAAASMPGTKLLETTPKGFNATGEYEEASYREGLESIQTNDLEPLLERHFEILAKDLALSTEGLSVVWNPLDSPTAKEYAEINLLKAQAAQTWSGTGAVDGTDIRKQLVQDRDSDFYGIDDAVPAAVGQTELDIDRYIDEAEREAGAVGNEPGASQARRQAPGVPGPGGAGL